MKDLILFFTLSLTLVAASMLKTENTQDAKPVQNQKFISYNK
jgi:hypothetical protein